MKSSLYYLCIFTFLIACQEKEEAIGRRALTEPPSQRKTDEVICPGDSLSGIIGGSSVAIGSEVARSTVSLHAVLSEEGGASCTGTLIGQDIVLTAAHCVKDIENRPENLMVSFPTQANCALESQRTLQRTVSAKAIRVHDDFDELSDIDKNDIALIKLSRPAPADMSPVPLVEEGADWTQETFLIAGYGRSEGGVGVDPRPAELRSIERRPLVADSYEKVKAVVKSVYFLEEDERLFDVFFARVFDLSKEAVYIWIDQTDRKGMCVGDSGGPAFVHRNGALKIAGVASHFVNTDKAEETCLLTSAYTNIQRNRSWIRTTYQAMTGLEMSKY